MGSDHLTIVFNVPVYSSDAGEKIIFPWSLKVKNMMLQDVAKTHPILLQNRYAYIVCTIITM